VTRILSFGEILIRQQLVGSRFFDPENNRLEIFPGGSEANVAVALAQMGEQVCYVSTLPQNALSREILGELQKRGVDTSRVFFSGDRIGTYILLSANGLTNGEVIYDRKYSAFSRLRLVDVDTDNLLEGADWLHWTALTPALNDKMALMMSKILREAKERQITVSVDLNYRDRLWYGKQPDRVMPQLVRHCDVVMGNIWAANKMLGTIVDQTLDRSTPKETYLKAAEASAREVFQKFPNCRHLAYTFRFMDHPRHNLFYGTYHRPDGGNVHSQTHETFEVVDRIGSGDAFMAGLIHGLIHKRSPQEIIDTATAAGFQKLFVRGDFC